MRPDEADILRVKGTSGNEKRPDASQKIISGSIAPRTLRVIRSPVVKLARVGSASWALSAPLPWSSDYGVRSGPIHP
jgi:hypothetical protein